MNRRRFVKQAAFTVGAVTSSNAHGSVWQTPMTSSKSRLTLHPDDELAEIPSDFLGLGYEISSVARPGLLSSTNTTYIQLVRTLSRKGVVRVGGNTSDYSIYEAQGQPRSVPEGQGGSVVNDVVLRDLGGFLRATGWDLVWGLNLGGGTEKDAIAEAKAVTAAAGPHLLAFEIGNEPDLFPRKLGHRKPGYGYDDYLAEYRRYRDALRTELPHVPLAGPDVADATSWVTRFAADEGKDLKLLTHHYYREGQNPTSSIDKLLHSDPKLGPTLKALEAASKASRVPYRICETNSFSGGGRPGVSDTLASALWVLDFMFTLASAGCAGVNMESGVNQRGFISSYSPLGDDEHGQYSATPEFYGMLAFAQSGKGRLVGADFDNEGKNITAYATQQTDRQRIITLINKEVSLSADVLLEGTPGASGGMVMRLFGSAIDGQTGVTLGGAAVSPSGAWNPGHSEQVSLSNGTLKVNVPAASAAIITLHV